MKLLLALSLIAASLGAQGTDVSSVTRTVPAGARALFPQAPDSYVTSRAPFLSLAEIARLNTNLQALRTTTGAQVAVVVLGKIDPFAPSDMAMYIGRAWGVSDTGSIGTAHRNLGAVLLIVPKTSTAKGRCFLAPANGAAAVITDGRAGQLCRDAVAFFKQGKNDEGVESIMSYVVGRMRAKAAEDPRHPLAPDQTFSEAHPSLVMILAVAIVLMIIVVVAVGAISSDDSGGSSGFSYGGGSEGDSSSGSSSSSSSGFSGGGGYDGGGGGSSW